MGKQFVSLVCVLCALHAHCAVHHGPAEPSPASATANVTRAGWLYAERLGSGLNPHLDLKPAAAHKPVDTSPRTAAGSHDVESRVGGETRPEPANTDDGGAGSRVSETESLAAKADGTILPESSGVESVNGGSVGAEAVRRGRSEELAGAEGAKRRVRESVGAADGADNVKYFVRKVFDKFGDGKSMTLEAFEQMMKALVTKGDEAAVPTSQNASNATTSSDRCVQHSSLFDAAAAASSSPRGLTDEGFLRLCPSLVYRLVAATENERSGGCLRLPAPLRPMRVTAHADQEPEENRGKVWLYSTLSIIAISLCGLLGVAVIPIMKNLYYQQMLQFFVALAVGTLCGDALLHLLPHAMATSGSHDHAHGGHGDHASPGGEDHAGHDEQMWKGLVAALGIVFLFFTEKSLSLISEWRQQHQRLRKDPPRVRVMRDKEAAVGNATVGEKLCKHKYSSYPYCYNEIAAEMTDDNHHKNGHHSTRDNHNHTSAPSGDHTTSRDNHHHHHHGDHAAIAAAGEEGAATEEAVTEAASAGAATEGKVPCVHDDHGDSACRNHVAADDTEKSALSKEQDTIGRDSYTVILREHEQTHHGHSHTHGHVHSPPESLSAVAWMVVMGDGLHNFTDGMAIGAAFAANIAGGFSTAVAVFCHELPHELGDFAVLLKAGMSAKQAVFYNVISSVLCLFGMVIGVSLGNWETATQWIFAAAAGMFLYIALVDMIPELSSSHSTPGGSLVPCGLQITGLLLGLGIMYLIAAHEEALKNVFTDKP